MPKTWTPAIASSFIFVGVDDYNVTLIDPRLQNKIQSNLALTGNDKSQFIAALKNLYEHSDTAAAIIDAAIGMQASRPGQAGGPTKLFYFMKTINNGFTYQNSNGAFLDPSLRGNFVDLKGQLSVDTLENFIIHEMTHAIVGVADYTNISRRYNYSDSDYSFPGPTQTIANNIAYEMGLKDFYQIGYNFTLSAADFAANGWTSNISLTEGNIVTAGVLSDANNNNKDIDLSQKVVSREVV